MTIFVGPLGSRNFRLLAAAVTVRQLGNSVAIVAQPFAIFAIGGTVADVSYAAAALLLPTVLFLLAGGVVADRFPRHLVLLWSNSLQGASQTVAAVLVLTGVGHPWQLIVLAAVRGIGTGFNHPAEEGLLPQTVEPRHLSQANAILHLGMQSSQILGASTGGLLVGFLGPGWALAVDAGSFGLAALCRVGMRFPTGRPRAASTSTLRELREGWREFAGRQWLWVIVAQFSIVVAVDVARTSVLGPLVARDDLGGPRSWGFIVAAASVGAAMGAVLMLRWRPRRLLLVATLVVFGEAGPLFALAVPLSVPLLCAVTFLAGIGFTVFGVCWSTTMQQEIPPTLLSRAASYDALGSLALAPVGGAVAGPLATAVGTRPALLGGGVLVVLVTAAALLSPDVRRLERRTGQIPTQRL